LKGSGLSLTRKGSVFVGECMLGNAGRVEVHESRLTAVFLVPSDAAADRMTLLYSSLGGRVSMQSSEFSLLPHHLSARVIA